MISKFSNKIGYQLSGLIFVATILLVLPVSFLIWDSINSFGKFASEVNETQIREQAYLYLKNSVSEQSKRYDNYFERVRVVATLMAQQTAQTYNDLLDGKKWENVTSTYHYQPNNKLYSVSGSDDVVTLYWGNKYIEEEVKHELAGLRVLENMLISAKTELGNSLATHIITESGIGKYYTERPEIRANAYQIPDPAVFDLRDGAPLAIFRTNKELKRTAQWTPVYKDDVIDGLMITASGPIIDRNNTFRGIAGVDLPLADITEELSATQHLHLTSNQFAFTALLIDRHGRFISFPETYWDLFGMTIDLSSFKDSADILEFSLADSEFPDVRKMHEQIISNDEGVFELELEGQRYILASQRMEHIGWNFILIVQEKDILNSVRQTHAAFKTTLQQLKINLLLLLLGGVCFFLCLLIFIRRYYVKPLAQIADTAHSVENGDFGVRCFLKRSDELGRVAEAINQMVRTIEKADIQRKSYAITLEGKIETRTVDLSRKNNELEGVVTRLNVEIKKRQAVTTALQESEAQIRSVMEFSLAGIYIISDGMFVYVNSAFAQMTGYSHEELTAMGPMGLVHNDYKDLVVKQISLRLQGFHGQPYYIKIVRKDGSNFDMQVEGAKINWRGKPSIVGNIIDISHIMRIEEQLRNNEQKLKKSLEEKEVLLKEVYHRTKNNMMVIISLLNLQADELKDGKSKSVFKEMENRIRAMSLVHEGLYQSENLAEIDLGEYLKKVAITLLDHMIVGGRQIPLRLSCEKVIISMDIAMVVGLVVNEIITNSIQHAFKNLEYGEVFIELDRHADGKISLLVGDNGAGMVEEHQAVTNSLGLQIIDSLIRQQLGGDYEVRRSGGTSFYLVFPSEKI